MPMLVMAAVGLVRYWKGHTAERGRIFQLTLISAYTLLIWAYRPVVFSRDFQDFHYLFVFMAFMSVFFGYAACSVAERLESQKIRASAFVVGFLCVAAIHYPVIWVRVDTRMRDVVQYRRLAQPFYAAVSIIGAGQKVAIMNQSANYDIDRLHGLANGYELISVFDAQFVCLCSPTTTSQLLSVDLQRSYIGAVIEIDPRGLPRGPFRPSEWEARRAAAQ
jgi:hypothetical protein